MMRLYDDELRQLARLVNSATPENAVVRRERTVALLNKFDWDRAIDAAQRVLIDEQSFSRVLSADGVEAALTAEIDHGRGIWIKDCLAKIRQYFVLADREAWPMAQILIALARLRACPDADPLFPSFATRRAGPLESSFYGGAQ